MAVSAANSYCEHLGVSVPSLARVRTHREANVFALLMVTLLEHGHPMTLDDIAEKFLTAGVVEHVDDALRSLKRCRPARPPIYRDGDLYGLDPHSSELDLWLFRLDLRGPRVQRPDPRPIPPRLPATQRLSIEELDEAWQHDANLHGWSAQRIALAILDAHDRPMTPDEVVAFVSARTETHRLAAGQTTFRRKNSAVTTGTDGIWSIVPDAPELLMARDAVRDAVATARRYPRTDPQEIKAFQHERERIRSAHAAELAALRRVIVHAFPARSPEVVVLVDIEQRELTTLIGDQLSQLDTLLQRFDILCGVDVRGTLRALAIEARDRRLAELGPPQKTARVSSHRTLEITTAMLIKGSCGISKVFGDEKKLRAYLAKRQLDKLAASLEADAKALLALHEYGRVQGCVRLLWNGFEYVFHVPWHHWDEPTLYDLKREAFGLSMGLVAVVGRAPPWDDPWSRARHLQVVGVSQYDLALFDEVGRFVDDRDVQLARLEAVIN